MPEKKAYKFHARVEAEEQQNGSWLASFTPLGLTAVGSTKEEAERSVMTLFVTKLNSMSEEQKSAFVANEAQAVMIEEGSCPIPDEERLPPTGGLVG